jgi:hypothetical protein
MCCCDIRSLQPRPFHSVGQSQNPHNLDLFLQQVYDVVHHTQLPLLQSKRFIIHGFSFGAFITLNYFDKYHSSSSLTTSSTSSSTTPVRCCEKGHTVHKLVFQSAWNGEIPLLVRPLLYIPGMLSLMKPNDMKDIHSIPALREILLNISSNNRFIEKVNSIATKAPSVEILFLSGCVEFYFTKNNKLMHRVLSSQWKNQQHSLHLRICKGADHLTFVHKTNSSVGEFYRDEVSAFVCKLELGDRNQC